MKKRSKKSTRKAWTVFRVHEKDKPGVQGWTMAYYRNKADAQKEAKRLNKHPAFGPAYRHFIAQVKESPKYIQAKHASKR